MKKGTIVPAQEKLVQKAGIRGCQQSLSQGVLARLCFPCEGFPRRRKDSIYVFIGVALKRSECSLMDVFYFYLWGFVGVMLMFVFVCCLFCAVLRPRNFIFFIFFLDLYLKTCRIYVLGEERLYFPFVI